MVKYIFLAILVVFIISLTFPKFVSAESSYVLPYPSYMPGNFLYQPRLFISKISKYIYFGDFGKFNYSLKESDHYLVEAKTLFEYKQYLLATDALRKSDVYFKLISPNLEKARVSGKDISEKELILKEASRKHMEVLGGLEQIIPEDFNWTPENSSSRYLNLEALIEESIKIRNSVL